MNSLQNIAALKQVIQRPTRYSIFILKKPKKKIRNAMCATPSLDVSVLFISNKYKQIYQDASKDASFFCFPEKNKFHLNLIRFLHTYYIEEIRKIRHMASVDSTRRSSGYFDIRRLDETNIHAGVSHRKLGFFETRHSTHNERRMAGQSRS